MPNIIANKMKADFITQSNNQLKNKYILKASIEFIINIEHKTALWF